MLIGCTFLESNIKDEILNYLDENNQLRNRQHEFKWYLACFAILLQFFCKVFIEHDLDKAVVVLRYSL